MADLRVDDETLSHVQSKLKSSVSRLEPVHRGVKSFDADVVGADPLVSALTRSHSLLAVELEILGKAISEIAAHVSDVGTTLEQADSGLAGRMRQEAQ